LVLSLDAQRAIADDNVLTGAPAGSVGLGVAKAVPGAGASAATTGSVSDPLNPGQKSSASWSWAAAGGSTPSSRFGGHTEPQVERRQCDDAQAENSGK
jgi:hypothetical protein